MELHGDAIIAVFSTLAIIGLVSVVLLLGLPKTLSQYIGILL